MRQALLVTGFLGGGKTTFVLKSLVERYKHKRLAIVVNDFGEISYDRLAYYQKGLKVMGVEGGCFCCESAGELESVISSLKDIDLLVVETSGLSDPYPVMQAMESSGFSSYLAVCVVPADSWIALQKEPLFLSQISYSHCVVASRCDLALEEDITQLEDYIKDKPMFLSYEGKVEEEFFTFFEGEKPKKTQSNHPTIHARERFSQITVKLEGYYHMHEMEDYLKRLPENIVRVKGYLKLVESPLPMGLNWTRNHLSWEPVENPVDSFLTFIGYGSLLLPPLPKRKSLEGGRMMPLGSFDRRQGIAYLYGEMVDELEAIYRLLSQDISNALLLKPEEYHGFYPQAKEVLVVKPEFEVLYSLSSDLKNKGIKDLILWKIPDAFASYLIEHLKDINIIHIATHYLLPKATLSLRVDTQEKEKALEILFKEKSPAQSGA